MRPRRTAKVVPLSALILLTLTAIPIASPTVAAASPTLTILSPADGATLANGTPAVVRFTVANFTLVQPGRVGQIAGPDEGYANAFLDGRLVRLLTDVEPFSLPLTSGPHTIRLELASSNGSALNPAVSAIVRVVSTHGPAQGVPGIVILSPAPMESTGHDVYVAFRIANFTLVEPRGQPNAPNEGHLQILVHGGVVMEIATQEPILIVALPDGFVMIGARLVNNDGSPLNPDASDVVPIRVAASSSLSLALILNGGMSLLLAFVLVVLILRRRAHSARAEESRGEDS